MVFEDVDYVNVYGLGTCQNDVYEMVVLKRSFGDHVYCVLVSSIKSMVGHLLGGIGVIEIAVSVLVIEHGVVLLMVNLMMFDLVCDLDYVLCIVRKLLIDVVLCIGSGFGGF